jgi:dienelactone hydrolase
MRSLYCLIGFAFTAPISAQSQRFYYPEPAASTFEVLRNIRFASTDTTTLLMDVYRPANASGVPPAIVFYTSGSQRANAGYTGWARAAAARRLIAILADLRQGAAPQDFRTLISHLADRGAVYGLDTAAIAVFGASSNAFNSFPLVQDPQTTRIKAAVMYYSSANVTTFRHDLPVLYIRAGLDRAFVNLGIDSLVARALMQNAPITVINHPAGHHGFETIDDDVITHDLIDQTIDFVKRATAPAYRAAVVKGAGYASAAAHVTAGDFAAAATAYAALVSREPDDAPLRLSYGEALLGDRQFGKACGEFEKLRGKGLGARDLGLPAARACMQNGDAAGAMAWLTSIPKRFLPPQVEGEVVFAPLRGRADFVALFRP